jgi:hypothetical protein
VYNRALSDSEIFTLYDPLTRWALYDTSVDYVWSDPVAAPGGRTARNTHAWPLGMNLGMHHWHNG